MVGGFCFLFLSLTTQKKQIGLEIFAPSFIILPPKYLECHQYYNKTTSESLETAFWIPRLRQTWVQRLAHGQCLYIFGHKIPVINFLILNSSLKTTFSITLFLLVPQYFQVHVLHLINAQPIASMQQHVFIQTFANLFMKVWGFSYKCCIFVANMLCNIYIINRTSNHLTSVFFWIRFS